MSEFDFRNLFHFTKSDNKQCFLAFSCISIKTNVYKHIQILHAQLMC